MTNFCVILHVKNLKFGSPSLYVPLKIWYCLPHDHILYYPFHYWLYDHNTLTYSVGMSKNGVFECTNPFLPLFSAQCLKMESFSIHGYGKGAVIFVIYPYDSTLKPHATTTHSSHHLIPWLQQEKCNSYTYFVSRTHKCDYYENCFHAATKSLIILETACGFWNIFCPMLVISICSGLQPTSFSQARMLQINHIGIPHNH